MRFFLLFRSMEYKFNDLETYFKSLYQNEELDELGYQCSECIGRGQSRPRISSMKLPQGAFVASGENRRHVRGRGRGRVHVPKEPPIQRQEHAAPTQVKPPSVIVDVKPEPPGEIPKEPERNANFIEQWLSSHFSEPETRPRFSTQKEIAVINKTRQKPSLKDYLECMDNISTSHKSKQSNVQQLLKSIDSRGSHCTSSQHGGSSYSGLSNSKREQSGNNEEKPKPLNSHTDHTVQSDQSSKIEINTREDKVTRLESSKYIENGIYPAGFEEVIQVDAGLSNSKREQSGNNEEKPKPLNSHTDHTVQSDQSSKIEINTQEDKVTRLESSKYIENGIYPAGFEEVIQVDDRTLIVIDIPEGGQECVLEDFFMSYGKIESCTIRGTTAEIVFEDEEYCDWALSCLEGGIDGLFCDFPDVIVTGYKKSCPP